MTKVEIKNADQLMKHLNSIADLNVKKTVINATALVHRTARNLAVFKHGTGLLRESIHMSVEDGAVVRGRVFTNSQYAVYVEFGTGQKGNGTYPYDIDGLSLTYTDHSWVYTPDGGETFRRTNGHEAQPFMYPALKSNERRIREMFTADIHDALKGG